MLRRLSSLGNQVRKLELLMAEALAGGCDCVVTVGGLQSNHCRATAAAARLVGLEAHLVLLVADHAAGDDPGLQGNLLLDRLLGARLHMCAASDYYKYGGDLAAMDKLNQLVASRLRAQGRKPYVVPVGGTTPMSAWAYISATDELITQCREGRLPTQEGGVPSEQGSVPPLPPQATERGRATAAAETLPFDHIVFAAGSGGTATGLALGCHLASVDAQLHAVNVQHTPATYYEAIDAEARALGIDSPASREWLTIHDGSSIGYGHSTTELLESIRDTCAASGVFCSRSLSLTHFLSLNFAHSLSLTHFILPTLSHPLYLTHFLSHTHVFPIYVTPHVSYLSPRPVCFWRGALGSRLYGQGAPLLLQGREGRPRSLSGESDPLLAHGGSLWAVQQVDAAQGFVAARGSAEARGA